MMQKNRYAGFLPILIHVHFDLILDQTVVEYDRFFAGVNYYLEI
jgi:hypothetical protein